MIADTWAIGTMRGAGRLAMLGLVAVLAGCTTPAGTSAEATGRAASLEVTVADPDAPSAEPSRSPDGYPDFSGSLTAANVQMGNKEAAELQAKLSALGAARKAGTISEAEYQRRLLELRKLAAEHGQDAQAQIAK
ncbi:MAG: SHOCT domain-containing protein [Rhizobium sp.]|nr:SHOCT domain-containing protein [Rhizobium sp.]